MNHKTIYQVDAFTDEAFKGNPAGIMIADHTITAEWMQNMAMEMNLSETAFIIPEDNDFQIRYFTPKTEVALCGHATLAAAHIVYELGLKKEKETIHFRAKEAKLRVRKSGDWILMDFPQYPLNKINPIADFKKTIGFEPLELYASSYNWILALAASEKDILQATPDFEAMKKNGLGHLMITAKSKSFSEDFVVRCFAPSLGINEDPVTGSAYCALTPFWAGKLGKSDLEAYQLSKRTGLVKLKNTDQRIEMSGKAVTVFEAELRI